MGINPGISPEPKTLHDFIGREKVYPIRLTAKRPFVGKWSRGRPSDAMTTELKSGPAFVIKPEEIAALNYLASNHPRPLALEWINRSRDRKLRQSSVEMLLRTLHQNMSTPSVVKLHRESGLRVVFRSEKDRSAFARAFTAAKDEFLTRERHHITALFGRQEDAEKAVSTLIAEGIPQTSIALMARADQFVIPEGKWPQGHSRMSIAASAVGGGFAGMALGLSIIMIPGFGALAVAGGLAASAIGSFAAASGIFGATGGAVARMLTDHDVDGISATYYQEQVRKGKIFVSVDARVADSQRELVRKILLDRGGQTRRS